MHVDLTQPHPSQRPGRFAWYVLTAVYLMVWSTVAAAEPWDGPVERIIDILTGNLARSIAVLVCIFLGYLAWAGRMTMTLAGSFILGIVLIFGSAAIADLFIGEV